MGITQFVCGCSISSSMFGEHEILSVHLCNKHVMQSQTELNSLADKVISLQKKEKKRA